MLTHSNGIEQRRAISLPPKKALAYAKLEIQRAPEVINDTELFSPVFRNLSVFKRYIQISEEFECVCV